MGYNDLLYVIVKADTDSFEKFTATYQSLRYDYAKCFALQDNSYLWFVKSDFRRTASQGRTPISTEVNRVTLNLHNSPSVLGFALYIEWETPDSSILELIRSSHGIEFYLTLDDDDDEVLLKQKGGGEMVLPDNCWIQDIRDERLNKLATHVHTDGGNSIVYTVKPEFYQPEFCLKRKMEEEVQDSSLSKKRH